MKEGKQIRIGNQSAFSAPTLIMPFEYAVSNGFNAFEWFPDRNNSGEGWDESDLDAETRGYIRDKARARDIGLSVHASLRASPLHPEERKLLYKDIQLAQDIGAGLLNIHLSNSAGIEHYVKAVIPVIKRTAEAGISLAIENTPMTTPEDFNRLFDLIQKQRGIKKSHVGMCLDLGHANLQESSRNDYLNFIDRLDERVPVIHIHAHENYGDSDSHLPVFTGPARTNLSGLIGFVKRMKGRGFAGSIILEQWPDPPLLLNEARDRLYHMFNHRED